MLRRTLLASGLAGWLLKRAKAQSRQNLAKKAAEDLANSPHKSDEVMSLPQEKLIAIVEDAESSEFAKAKACQRLGVIADDSAVPALAKLLADPKLGHYARTALEPMPGKAADQALRQAAAALTGNALIGVVNSIGLRRDEGAISILSKLRRHQDKGVRQAALAALARVRAPE